MNPINKAREALDEVITTMDKDEIIELERASDLLGYKFIVDLINDVEELKQGLAYAIKVSNSVSQDKQG